MSVYVSCSETIETTQIFSFRKLRILVKIGIYIDQTEINNLIK